MKTKKGMASIYIVAFTTIVLSVITLSFVRIMLSETTQTSNSDLSQSAYDSALAGIEDAKVAILKYHDCLSQGYTKSAAATPGSCERVIYEMQEGIESSSCDVVSNVLNRQSVGSQGETIIEESDTNADNNSTYMDQAYTCVKISEVLKDYRSTLNKDYRTRIVPLRTASPNDVKYIKFNWFSDYNISQRSSSCSSTVSPIETGGKFPKNTTAECSYPVIGLDIYQTNANGFYLGELSVNNGNNTGTDHAKLILYPQSGDTPTPAISKDSILENSDKEDYGVFGVNCTSNSTGAHNMHDNDHEGFSCSALIQLPEPFRGGDRAQSTFFLRVALPYGAPETDFSVTLCKDTADCYSGSSSASSVAGSNALDFVSVQTLIDSTGRANDLYRRVETRLEIVDLDYPYPEFEIQLEDRNNDLDKAFWVTYNCWAANNGGAASCENYGEADDYNL